MAAETPTALPAFIFAGDTLKFKISNPDYSATDGWVMSFSFVRTGSLITISSSASGGDHLFNVTATTTAGYTAGSYEYQCYVTKSPERYFIGSGAFEVKANYATQTTGYDGRSIVKKTLDALENALYGRASQVELSISVGDRTISKLSPEQIIVAIDKYRSLYQSELASSQLSSGAKNTKNNFYVRFSR